MTVPLARRAGFSEEDLAAEPCPVELASRTKLVSNTFLFETGTRQRSKAASNSPPP
jgi:hypothetical protein